MDEYSYIRHRMRKLGYDPDDVQIEPIRVDMDSSLAQDRIIREPNVYYYLYDVAFYDLNWTIESDINHVTNAEFIVDERVPVSPVEFTGNIRITTPITSMNVFMFYKVITGKLIT